MKNLNYVLFALVAGIAFEGVLSAEWYSAHGTLNSRRKSKDICPRICGEGGATWTGKSRNAQYLDGADGLCECVKAANS
jgi:hypothetical protein